MENFEHDAILAQYSANTAKETFSNNIVKVAFNETNYVDTKLKAGENERTIDVRFLPIDPNGVSPFETIFSHWFKCHDGKWKNIPCTQKTYEVLQRDLTTLKNTGNDAYRAGRHDEVERIGKMIENKKAQIATIENKYGTRCPFCEKSAELYETFKQTQQKELQDMSKSLRPKQTFITRVIEIGKEEDGPKFCKFNHSHKGNGIYDSLISNYTNHMKELGNNIFDLENGCKVTLTIKRNDKGKTEMMNNVTVGLKTYPIGTPEQINKWVNDNKTWIDVYSPKTYEFNKIMLDGDTPVFNKELNKYVGVNSSKQEQEENRVAVENTANSIMDNPF